MYKRVASSSFMDNRGPESAAEMASWDKDLLNKFSRIEKERVYGLLSHGVVYSSDFSGMDCPKESLSLLLDALAKDMDVPAVEFIKARSCDWDALPLKVLREQSLKTDGKACVFGDVSDRLAAEGQEHIIDLAPTKTSSPESAASQNVEINDYLHDNKAWLFEPNRMAFCFMHQRQCVCYPGAVYSTPQCFEQYMNDEVTIRGEPPRNLAKKQRRMTQALPIVEAEECASKTPWWVTVLENLTEPVEVRPLIINVAGIPCIDWTSLGKQRRGSGPTNRFHNIHMIEREILASCMMEDIFITECAERYSAEEFQAPGLAKTHDVKIFRLCPRDIGFPMRRRRTFTVGINFETLVWVGKPTHLAAQQDFLELLGRTVEVTGDVYFYAGQEEVNQFVQQRILKRKNQVPAGFADTPMEDLLHLLCARTTHERKAVYDLAKKDMSSPGGSFLVDLEQRCFMGSSPGAYVPALNTHSEIYSYLSGRLATSNEYMFMQGFDSDAAICGSRPVSPMMLSIDGLAQLETRFLVGNGMHVPLFSTLLMYVFSNVVRREMPDPFKDFPLVVDVIDEDEDGGEEGSSSYTSEVTWSTPSTLPNNGEARGPYDELPIEDAQAAEAREQVAEAGRMYESEDVE